MHLCVAHDVIYIPLQYYEPLKLYYGHASSLELRLKGVAVKPQVSLSLENGSGTHELDMGHVMAGDTITKTLHLHNSSPLDVKYSITLESLEPRGAQRNDFSKSVCVHRKSTH